MYKGISELCMLKYRDSEGLYVGLTEAAFCTARSQLLMNLHDANLTDLCKQVRRPASSQLAGCRCRGPCSHPSTPPPPSLGYVLCPLCAVP